MEYRLHANTCTHTHSSTKTKHQQAIESLLLIWKLKGMSHCTVYNYICIYIFIFSPYVCSLLYLCLFLPFPSLTSQIIVSMLLKSSPSLKSGHYPLHALQLRSATQEACQKYFSKGETFATKDSSIQVNGIQLLQIIMISNNNLLYFLNQPHLWLPIALSTLQAYYIWFLDCCFDVGIAIFVSQLPKFTH